MLLNSFFVHRFWSGVKHGFRYSQCLLLDFIQKCSSLVPAKASSKAGLVSRAHIFKINDAFFITPIFYNVFLQFLPFVSHKLYWYNGFHHDL